jgi:DNA-binding SARP family transcriptional activator
VFERRAVEALRRGDAAADELRSIVDSDDGELFPDDRYADWSTSARDRLADRAASVAESLASVLLARGDALGALDASERVLARDALRERATAVAMEASLAVGDRVNAARLYRRLEKVLGDELGIRPSADVQRLAASLDASPSVDRQ